MLSRICLIIALTVSLSGCIAIPEFDVSERIDFDHVPNGPSQLTDDEKLCCHRCAS